MDDEEYQRWEHQQDLDRIAGFRLLDDDFMSVVFQDEPTCTGILLRVIIFHCKEPDEMYHPELAARARYFKKTEEGVKTMCKAMEDMRKETAKRAETKKKKKTALAMLHDNMPIKKICM